MKDALQFCSFADIPVGGKFIRPYDDDPKDGYPIWEKSKGKCRSSDGREEVITQGSGFIRVTY